MYSLLPFACSGEFFGLKLGMKKARGGEKDENEEEWIPSFSNPIPYLGAKIGRKGKERRRER